MKHFCSIHHLYYNGIVCPLCEKERIENLVNRYNKQISNGKKAKNEREITENDIEKLKNKFKHN